MKSEIAVSGVAICAIHLLLSAAPSLAFNCYVGESPRGFVTVHELPSERSKVLAQLTQFNMVGDVSDIEETPNWTYVRWSREQTTQETFEKGLGDGAGWIKRLEVKGECED